MLLAVIPQHGRHAHQHARTHAPSYPHAHERSALQLTATPGLLLRAAWSPLSARRGFPAASSGFSSAKKHSFCPPQSSRRRARSARAAPPGSPRGSAPAAALGAPRRAAPRSACVPAEPRAACLELRCLLSASPATRKAVYGDTQCEKGADLKRRRMQARTTKVSYSKVCASPLLSSTP